MLRRQTQLFAQALVEGGLRNGTTQRAHLPRESARGVPGARLRRSRASAARDRRAVPHTHARGGCAWQVPLGLRRGWRATRGVPGVLSTGPGRLIDELASYLRRADTAGTLMMSHPRRAADLFLSIFMGDGHIRGLLMLDMPSNRDNRALLREAVRSLWPLTRSAPERQRVEWETRCAVTSDAAATAAATSSALVIQARASLELDDDFALCASIRKRMWLFCGPTHAAPR